MGDIDTESLNTFIGPESEGFDKVVSNFLIVPVEIRLGSIEEVEIPLTVSYGFPS